MTTKKTSWMVGIMLTNEEKFTFNQMRFHTKAQAERYVKLLSVRWSKSIRGWTIEQSYDKPNIGDMS